MKREEVLKNLFKKKTKDYLYTSLFFFISAFFILFAIKPSLEVAFRLNRKMIDLKKADAVYESAIEKLLRLQGDLEKFRDDFVYLDQALPVKIQIAKVLKDITDSLSQNQLLINRLTIADIKLIRGEKNKKGELNSILINLEVAGDFKNFYSFLKDINNQRRLKTINNVSISKSSKANPLATGSAKLKINLSLKSYFL